jgi:hypothetical protein
MHTPIFFGSATPNACRRFLDGARNAIDVNRAATFSTEECSACAINRFAAQRTRKSNDLPHRHSRKWQASIICVHGRKAYELIHLSRRESAIDDEGRAGDIAAGVAR